MENGELHVGDEIVITGPTTGAVIMKVEEIRVDLKPVEKKLSKATDSLSALMKKSAQATKCLFGKQLKRLERKKLSNK